MRRIGENGTVRSRATGFFAAAPLLLALACLAAPVQLATGKSSSQPTGKVDLKPFLGTWKGSFQGDVFAILILKEDKGELVGTLNNFDIVYDAQGNVADGTHTDLGDAPLLRIRHKPGELSFVVIEKDQYHPSDEWKFVPKSATEGELTQLLEGEPYTVNGTPVKPIRMVRESSATDSKERARTPSKARQ